MPTNFNLHQEDPSELLLNFKNFDKFIGYLKSNEPNSIDRYVQPSLKREQGARYQVELCVLFYSIKLEA